MSFQITNERHFFEVIGISEEKYNEIKENQASYYKPFIKKERKADGIIKERPLCPSIGLLNTVQERIKNRILDQFPLPDYIVGGVKGHDSISNSKAHIGKNYHFCLDIQNFFPSVSYARVNKTLMKLGFHPVVSGKLSTLITFKGHVPQGIPTSTIICNLALLQDLDQRILKAIEGKGIVYTRFVDDINFSSQSDFLPIIKEIVNGVISSGYKINKAKTYYKKGPVVMTGSEVCNNGLKTLKKHLDKLEDPKRSVRSKAGVKSFIARQKSV